MGEISNAMDADFGLELRLEKGMGIGTGMGSSASSAAAGAKAAQYFLEDEAWRRNPGPESNVPISVLLEACIAAEEAIDGGIHGDNAAASFLGGFIVIPSSRDPLIYSKFALPTNMRIVLATPPISILTEDARKIIPSHVELSKTVNNIGYSGLVIAGIVKQDLVMMGTGINDAIIEPVRSSLIPNFYQVKEAALRAGAYGCSISGAGPTVFAIADDQMDLRTIGEAMAEAFAAEDPVDVRIGYPNNQGAQVIDRQYRFG